MPFKQSDNYIDSYQGKIGRFLEVSKFRKLLIYNLLSIFTN